jgi:Na+/H+ antiporter NhaD/arsenite permease-like protein
MLAGAVAALVSGGISICDAFYAVQPEVMFFLFGMFIVGEAVSASGYVWRVSAYIRKVAKTTDRLLILLIGVIAVASAVLMNDTVAIIGTPLVLSLALRYNIPPVAILLTLCFSLTTGSVPSPIGNPQNLLIVSYLNPENPFLLFFSGLIVPTLISLLFIFIIMRGRFKDSFPRNLSDEAFYSLSASPQEPDQRLIFATRLSLFILVCMIVLHSIGPRFCEWASFPLGYIALVAALPILVIARQRVSILSAIDWRTLIFFAAMFVLMQSVYNSGWFQASVPFSSITSVPLIFAAGIILSQFISNVPFIALFQPAILASGITTSGILSLAAGSTIAGNLTILGAASNVIVIQQAEKYGIQISFLDFLYVGLPLTIIQGVVFALWLVI